MCSPRNLTAQRGVLLDPSIARVANLYPAAATQPLDVLAFRLPDSVDRHEAKAELIRQLHNLGYGVTLTKVA